MTGADDKQTIQVVDILKRFERSDKVRILDFGAGKGRLASVIYDSLDKTTLSDWLDYIAFDTNTDTKVECESAIARIYGSADKRYFNTNQDLFSNFDNASFDAVVMCNVLHEIDPKDWLTLFAPSGPIAKLLKEGGVLLLVEDNQMPVGEKPHQKGFVVLDTAELKALFAIREGDLKFKVYPDRNGRLKAHEIPRECLARVTADTRKAAMLMLFHVAKENIKALRKVAGTYQNGRLHGFWVQQFANASLVLDENKPQ
jgi:SAM-dependent methyltransferase